MGKTESVHQGFENCRKEGLAGHGQGGRHQLVEAPI